MLRGIDISHWQGSVDYASIKSQPDIDFVILKAGGSDSGFYEDSMFREYLNGFQSVGLPILGAYYFVGPGFISTEDGLADAYRFADMLDGTGLTYAILDLESTSSETREGTTDASIAFMDVLIQRGYKPIIYASDISGFAEKLNIDRLADYPKWVARYGSEPQYVSDYVLWQYSSDGMVPGISGSVDMDYLYDDSYINIESSSEYPSGEPFDDGVMPAEAARGIVAGLYERLLRRTYDGENPGLEEALRYGQMSRLDAFNDIYSSEEYQKKQLIIGCYNFMRGCDPSNEELDAWFHQDEDTIRNGIIYSDECNNTYSY
jgi:GH25 family lysozyme M1 (1,4-beta-N-acetylmuramidase)